MDPGVLAVLALDTVFAFEAALVVQVVFLEVGQDRAILAVQPGQIGDAVRDVFEIANAEHVASVLRPGDAAARDVPVVHGIAGRGDGETKALQLLFGTVHRLILAWLPFLPFSPHPFRPNGRPQNSAQRTPLKGNAPLIDLAS